MTEAKNKITRDKSGFIGGFTNTSEIFKPNLKKSTMFFLTKYLHVLNQNIVFLDAAVSLAAVAPTCQ